MAIYLISNFDIFSVSFCQLAESIWYLLHQAFFEELYRDVCRHISSSSSRFEGEPFIHFLFSPSPKKKVTWCDITRPSMPFVMSSTPKPPFWKFVVEDLAYCCRVMRRCSVLHEAHVLISINVMKTWNQSSFQNFKVSLCIYRVPEDHRTYERVNCDSRPN